MDTQQQQQQPAWYLEPEETRYECQQYSSLIARVNLKDAAGKVAEHLGDVQFEGEARHSDEGGVAWTYTCKHFHPDGSRYRLTCEQQEDGSFVVTAELAGSVGSVVV
jgi:hypothetical protein